MVLSSVGSWIVQIRREEETMRYKHFPPFFFALFHPYAARWVGLFFGTISVYVAGFEKVKKKTNALPHGSPAPVAAPFSIFFTMAALTQRSLQYYLGQMHGIGGCPTAPMQLTLMTRFPPKNYHHCPYFFSIFPSFLCYDLKLLRGGRYDVLFSLLDPSVNPYLHLYLFQCRFACWLLYRNKSTTAVYHLTFTASGSQTSIKSAAKILF